MLARIPVYSDENNLHFISIFEEESDGTFKRTQTEPLRMLRDNIDGISTAQGDVVSPKFDKNPRRWKSPTVSFHYGRPQSIYQFLRDKVAANKFYVFTKPSLSGRIIKFTLHELKLKPSMSQQKIKLLKEKYVESLELWSSEQYTNYLRRKRAAGVGIKARQQRLLIKKKQAFKKLLESHRPGEEKQHPVEGFIRYRRINVSDESGLTPEPTPRTSPISIFKSRRSKKASTRTDQSDDFGKRSIFDID
ncbi:hypothetical protein [Kaarinaea lacus]